jgi:hypothetical protein
MIIQVTPFGKGSSIAMRFNSLLVFAWRQRNSDTYFAVIDIAARPAIYYRHGEEGRFSAKSGN